MAKEVLINDGGAPARIYPFIAIAAVTAGMVLKVDSDGEVLAATAGTLPIVGVALTDAPAVGDMVNVVAGRGVILNVLCKDEAAGVTMMVDTSGTAGTLDAVGATTDHPVAITLENNSGDDVLTKCMLL